jgi:hypothetical protein
VARFYIDIDDADEFEFFDSHAFVYGYQAEIPNPVPQGNVPDANGFPVPDPAWLATIPNPQSLEAFTRARTIDHFLQVIDMARTQRAIAAAQAAAAAAGPVTIT